MPEECSSGARKRILILAVFFGILFLCVIGQAFRLQILKHEDMLKKADRQHQRIVPLTPARGAILDRNGSNLAVSIEMDSFYAEPRNIEDKDGTAAVLASFMEMTKQELLEKLNSGKGFVWLERRIPPERAARIKNLKLRGIGSAPEVRRFYPNSELAAHVIGFTGLDPIGLDGIELKYDSTIVGNTGFIVTERDALGRSVAQKTALIKNASKGNNVVLTLDKNIQYIAEKE